MTSRRLPTVALLALIVAAGIAESARAAPALMVAGASFARTVPFIDGSIYTFECHAAAAAAQTTTISSCTLTDGFHNAAAPATTSQGQTAFTDSAVSTNPTYSWRVCWTASATYADGSTQSTSGCTTTSSIAGAG
jgi:hypothetical protein